MFTVNEFKWLTINDTCMREFNNWSRPYEYAYVLQKLNTLPHHEPSIHNTCCGTGDIHLQFAQRLNIISPNVTHSDMLISNLFSNSLTNFTKYDLYHKSDKTYDVVICVSSLEDAYDINPANADLAFSNMIDQVNPDGRLLITCDYPTVSLEWCENLLGQKISNTSPRLNSMNSVYPRTDFAHYNIIAMDLTKK